MIALALVAFAVPATSASSDRSEALARTEQLEGRLQSLRARDGAEHVEGALHQAERALAQARARYDDVDAARRAQSIAEAALTLADRQLARRAAYESLLEARRRLASVRERARAQRRVLEALMRERAALARSLETGP